MVQTNKKTVRFILFCLLTALFALTLTACNKNAEPIYLTIDGDIKGDIVRVDLAQQKQTEYLYDDDGEEKQGEGWELSAVFEGIEFLYPQNKVMITATDGVSAVLQYPLTSAVYLYQNEDGKLCAKGIDYPKVVGIKDISEITVVTTEDATGGYKVLTPTETSYISRGNAKLKLFSLAATNLFKENAADKYTKAADPSVSCFTGRSKNIVYFEDFDIAKNTSGALLDWKDGKLVCDSGNGAKAVFGFVTGTDTLIQDAYYEMKEAVDEDQKVMFILPDGFSWEQANVFNEELTTLKLNENATVAASTHLSISPVALAAIVTGQPPITNGVFFQDGESRAVLPLAVEDIFGYAENAGKSVAYIEGRGNLILTSVTPEYSLSDNEAYLKAMQAVNAGKDLIFVHFHETDDTNHKYGPLSIQAKTKLLTIETYIADLIHAFEGKVVVVPDHGHNTLYDTLGNPYGDHGLFTALDMYVPFYVFEGAYED